MNMAGPVDKSTLPGAIPVFPLAGAILLPAGTLPLNIFEPRYLTMIRDAKRTDGLIGMVQPVGGDPAKPDLYPTGCAGRIGHFEETPDGRILVGLEGVARFRIIGELDVTTPYRQMQVDWSPFADDEPPGTLGEARPALLAGLKRFLETRGLSADWGAVDLAPDQVLVNQLAMLCPFEPAEKQALLEEATLGGRARLLETLLAFSAAAAASSPTNTRN